MQLRCHPLRVPYPFRALLALSSDLDGTRTCADYTELLRFLNTAEQTRFGAGVNLEFANSLYGTARSGEFSFRDATPAERAQLGALSRAGFIDTLHSYGDLTRTREDVTAVLQDFAAADCRFRVWVDHSQAPTNLGLFQTAGSGDVPGSPAYHADLSVRHGIRYCWRGQVSSLIGQDCDRALPGLLAAQVAASRLATVKELGKCVLSALGSQRYAMHARNRCVSRVRLRDGSEMLEFLRCNPHPRGLPHGDDAAELAVALSPAVLDRLVAREACMILYTHMGRGLPLPGSAAHRPFRAVFEHIARLHAERKLLLLTTARALDFIAARDFGVATLQHEAGQAHLRIGAAAGDALMEDCLQRTGGAGLSFVTPRAQHTAVTVCGREARFVQQPHARADLQVVSIPLPALEYPQL